MFGTQIQWLMPLQKAHVKAQRKEDHVKMQIEIGVMQLQAKEHQELSEDNRS